MMESAVSISSKPRLVVLGGGGHAKVAIETLRAAGLYEPVGFLSEGSSADIVLGLSRLGGDDALFRLRGEGISHVFPAVGNNAVRARIAAEAVEAGFALASAVSPFAHVSDSASIGAGVLVVAGAVINAEAVVEDLVIVNTNASVDHDCRIGAAAHIAPRSALAGCVSVGAQALVGIGASVLPNRRIGAYAIVGGGSCVVTDIPAGVTAYGVPARVIT